MLDPNSMVNELIRRARAAQTEFETYSQERVDKAVRAIGKSVYDHGDELAKMGAEESGMGRYEDKIVKNQGKSKMTWWRLKGVKSRGIINIDREKQIYEIAKPIGVLGVVTPATNPTMTPVHNAMIALKGANAVIICPHPKTRKTTSKTVEYMRLALKDISVPEDLIQIVDDPSIEVSQALMALCDTTISTGGPGMVKSAYSSGKPAIGVGPGNVQCLVGDDADIDAIVPKIMKGRTYDNGVLCTCEQSIICAENLYDRLVKGLVDNGAYFVKEDEVEKLRNGFFPGGVMNKNLVGSSPFEIAKASGFEVQEESKILLVPVSKTGKDEFLAKEKLAPILALYKYSEWKEAVDIALKNLLNEGRGHSVVIHSANKTNIEYAANILPVSRVGVGMVGSSGLGGGFDNGFMPTATLGCGSWGNNSIAGNVWWNHLVNITKLAYVLNDVSIPTDEEIWAE